MLPWSIIALTYSADVGVGKVAGIKFDPATGDMKNRLRAGRRDHGVPAAVRPEGQAGLDAEGHRLEEVGGGEEPPSGSVASAAARTSRRARD
jgi:hypothetical protein